MHQGKIKKILIYFFLFLLVVSYNNKNFQNYRFFQIDKINVDGLDEISNKKLKQKLNVFKFKNLLFLERSIIKEVVHSNNLVEEFSVFKNYPSTIEIKIKKVDILAKVKKEEQNFFLGSNGKLIEINENNNEIPFIFGNFQNENFFDLKEIIDLVNFNYNDIQNLFFFKSGRWDIETYSGILIKLPRKNLKQSLELAVKILNNDLQNNIKEIDLRQKNQVILNES